MAWDFETEPEFEEKLALDARVHRRRADPARADLRRAAADEWRSVKRHLQDQVKAQGLWGAFLDPKLGGSGFGQLKLALMSEIIGRCMMSMDDLRRAGARQRQHGAARPRRDRRAEGALALAQPPRRDLQRVRARPSRSSPAPTRP